jgi:hypothetical protein
MVPGLSESISRALPIVLSASSTATNIPCGGSHTRKPRVQMTPMRWRRHGPRKNGARSMGSARSSLANIKSANSTLASMPLAMRAATFAARLQKPRLRVSSRWRSSLGSGLTATTLTSNHLSPGVTPGISMTSKWPLWQASISTLFRNAVLIPWPERARPCGSTTRRAHRSHDDTWGVGFGRRPLHLVNDAEADWSQVAPCLPWTDRGSNQAASGGALLGPFPF